jgi:predicted NBD/HSP70 family sugar kinase
VDVAQGASHGDQVSVELLQHSGSLIGDTLAWIVNFFNPGLIVIGGGVAAAGDRLLATIRESVYRRSLPLATRDLRVVRSPLDDRAGLMGGPSWSWTSCSPAAVRPLDRGRLTNRPADLVSSGPVHATS